MVCKTEPKTRQLFTKTRQLTKTTKTIDLECRLKDRVYLYFFYNLRPMQWWSLVGQKDFMVCSLLSVPLFVFYLSSQTFREVSLLCPYVLTVGLPKCHLHQLPIWDRLRDSTSSLDLLCSSPGFNDARKSYWSIRIPSWQIMPRRVIGEWLGNTKVK